MIIILKFIVALLGLNFIITGLEAYLLFPLSRTSKFKIFLNLICAAAAVGLFFLYTNTLLDEADSKPKIKEDTIQTKEIPYKKLKATYYNPVQAQCDGNPLITATGYRINLKKLKRNEIRVVALSRDLLKQYPYNSEIYVHSPVHLRGCWRVEDTMNKRFSNRVDFLAYGKVDVDSVKIL
jgi:3D (Asp-Asp-Asp) domain-containing protein